MTHGRLSFAKRRAFAGGASAVSVGWAMALAAPALAQQESGGGLFEQSLDAGEAAVLDSAEESGVPEARYELGGYVRADAFVGKVPGFATGVVKAAYGELDLTFRASSPGKGSAFAEARLRHGRQGDADGLIVDLREAYLDAYFGPLDLRVGHQIIVWGRADAFNPTNNLTPVDLRVRSPLEDDRRVANFGARAHLTFAPLRLEMVWLPLYRPVEFPGIEPVEGITIGTPDFPEPELSNGLGAVRLHLELPSFELSLSQLYGHAPLPGFALGEFSVGEDAEVVVRRTAYDQLVTGADFSTVLGSSLGLRGEIAYRHPLQHEERVFAARPDLQYVLGLDRTFGSLSVIAQYVGRYVFDWQREPGPDQAIDPSVLATFTPPLPVFLQEEITGSIEAELSRRNQIVFGQIARLQHLASLRVEWSAMHETLTATALGLVNVTTREWLLYPKLVYRFDDRLQTSIGAEIYAGPDDTLLGLVDEVLSAGYAELRLSF